LPNKAPQVRKVDVSFINLGFFADTDADAADD